MNGDILRGKWNQIKGQARQRWGQLTDDDLDRIRSSRDKLVDVIQERYGESREAVEKEVDSWNAKP